MPMGLYNAPAAFQSLMKNIFHDCIDDFFVIYMAHLLIFSEDKESHYHHLETILFRLNELELYISPKKFEFLQDNIDFLGVQFGKGGIR